jgi:hypothetical protein
LAAADFGHALQRQSGCTVMVIDKRANSHTRSTLSTATVNRSGCSFGL